MKAALLKEFGKPLVIEDIDEPTIGPNDALLEVKACGLCYSDIRIWRGAGLVQPKLPHILGHEVSGIVSKVGSDLQGVPVGERVVAYLYLPCGRCYHCRVGAENLCKDITWFLGFNAPGGFAEYVRIPGQNLIKVPKNLRFEDAAILPDAIISPYHAVTEKARARLGETAMVVGMGGLGFGALQTLKLVGASVISVSRTVDKLRMAEKLGSDLTINSKERKVVDEVMKFTDGQGVDHVIDCVCLRETFTDDLQCLRRGGKLVMLAYNPDSLPPETQSITVTKHLQLIGSRGGTRQNLLDIVRLASDGRLKSIVTRTFRLEELNGGLELLSRGGILGRATLVMD